MIALFGFQHSYAQEFELQILNKEALFSIASILEDVDGDGDPDIIITRRSHSGVPSGVDWLENDPTLQFPRHDMFSKEVIASDVTQAQIVEADDIDDDEDVDIVFGGSDGRILWNTGDATFENGPELFTWDDFFPSAARGLAITDLKDDGVKDILTFSGEGSGGLFFLDGSDNFNQTSIDQVGIDLGGDILAADIDDNGLTDIIRQVYGEDMLIILYQDQPMLFRREILEHNWDNRGPSQMSLVDLDSDDDIELIFPENGNVDGDFSWYENINGELHRHQLYMDLCGARIPKIADLDGDDDPDIILTQGDELRSDEEIIWFENRGNDGFVDWLIAGSLDHPADIEVADLDGDGNPDLVAIARDDNDLLWFKKNGVHTEAAVFRDKLYK